MAVKLITEHILEESHVLRATEQASPYWPQPDPDSSNSGSIVLMTSGGATTASEPAEATSDGSTTTFIDSSFRIYGDGYFVGWTITFTSGSNNGLTRTITAFDGTTGTFTFDAVSASTLTNDTATISLDVDSASFVVELTTGGNLGDAEFKWSFDGGSNYLGRQSYEANWAATNQQQVIGSGATTTDRGGVVRLSDGTLRCFFRNTSVNKVQYRDSTDNGRTWGSVTDAFQPPGVTPYLLSKPLRLSTGRILLPTYHYWYYSDDDGNTWKKSTIYSSSTKFVDVVEISPNIVGFVYINTGSHLAFKISTDSGESCGNEITIENTTDAFSHPLITKKANGNLLVGGYVSGITTVHFFESEDNGATWRSSMSSIGSGAGTPLGLITDLDGSLWFIDENYVYHSTDLSTWSTGVANGLPTGPGSVVQDNQRLFAFNRNYYLNRIGEWETYSSNTIPVPHDASSLQITYDQEITFRGENGVSGDKWTWTIAYEYAKENILSHSPQKEWRSTSIGDKEIVFDIGENMADYVDSMVVINTNVRSFYIQMNDSDSWTSPPTDEHMSTQIKPGNISIEDVRGNMIKASSFLSSFNDHELAGNQILINYDGGSKWKTLRVKTNIGDYIVTETALPSGIAAGDHFWLYSSRKAYLFSGDVRRYIRIFMQNQSAAEDYHYIGTLILGKRLNLPSDPRVGYRTTWDMGIDLVKGPGIGPIPINRADPKRIITLTWTTNNPDQILNIIKYAQGRNIALLLDDSKPTEVILVKAITSENIEVNHKFTDWYDITVSFEEVL